MPQDRISKLLIAGLRTLKHVEIELDNLTVLAGVNGSGKSSIVEACEILHRAASPKFHEEFLTIHGGFDTLKRFGSDSMQFGVCIEGAGPSLYYRFAIEDVYGLFVSEESLKFADDAVPIIERRGREAFVLDAKNGRMSIKGFPGAGLLLTGFGFKYPHPEMRRVVRALQQIEVHLPFDVLPAWAAREAGRSSPMRVSAMHQPTNILRRLGANLANVYDALRKDTNEWEVTMEYVRIGLGDDFEYILPKPLEAGEGMTLWVKYTSSDKEVPASSLSDGTLDYLAFVALARLKAQRSLLVLDEPELHLHPSLMMRVLDVLETLSKDCSVLTTTHSDRVLDALTDPTRAIVICELDDQRATRILRPDPDAFERWLASYRGFGSIRAEGMEASVLAESIER